MVVEQSEVAFRLLQLVALALPAVAIYLQVLTTIYSEPEPASRLEGIDKDALGNRVDWKEVVVLTKAGEKRATGFALVSLLLFLMSAIPLALRTAFSFEFLVWVGQFFIIAAVGAFAISVALTMDGTL